MHFDADDDFIKWVDMTITELALNKSLYYTSLTKCIPNPRAIDEVILPKIKLFPCHNQATERCV